MCHDMPAQVSGFRSHNIEIRCRKLLRKGLLFCICVYVVKDFKRENLLLRCSQRQTYWDCLIFMMSIIITVLSTQKLSGWLDNKQDYPFGCQVFKSVANLFILFFYSFLVGHCIFLYLLSDCENCYQIFCKKLPAIRYTPTLPNLRSIKLQHMELNTKTDLVVNNGYLKIIIFYSSFNTNILEKA